MLRIFFVTKKNLDLFVGAACREIGWRAPKVASPSFGIESPLSTAAAGTDFVVFDFGFSLRSLQVSLLLLCNILTFNPCMWIHLSL